MKRIACGLLVYFLSSLTIVIAADPIEFIREGSSSYQCVKIKDGQQTFVSPHAEEYKALQSCIAEQKRDLEAGETGYEYEAISIKRVRIKFSTALSDKWTGGGATPPSGEGDTPPAGWSTNRIQGTANPVVNDSFLYTSGSGEFQVTAEGGAYTFTEDSFPSWMYTSDTTSDYTVTACLTDATQLSELPDKAHSGMEVRDGLADDDRLFFAGIVGLDGFRTRKRTVDAGTAAIDTLDSNTVILPEGIRFEVDRALSSLKMYRSPDCSTGWVEQSQDNNSMFDSGNTLYFHLPATPQDTQNLGLTSFAKYDTVSVSTANVDHGGAGSSTVGFTAPAISQSEETTPMVFTVERNGSGSGSCSVDWSLLTGGSNGTAVAGTDYTDASGTLSWADTDTADKTFNVTIIDRDAVVQGNKTFTASIAANTCSDTLSPTTKLATILDQDSSGVSFTANTTSYDAIVRGHAGQGLDWTTYLATAPTYEVVYITNTNTSGTGSLDACVSGTGSTLRFCVPTVSGLIEYPESTASNPQSTNVSRDNLIVAMHVAPSPGLYVKGSSFKIRGTRQLWMHFGCFTFDDGATQANGKCTQLNSAQSSETDVVLMNYGSMFGRDGQSEIFKGYTRTSFIQSMLGPANAGDVGGGASFGILLGEETSNTSTFARNVVAHARGRNPKVNEHDETEVINNVSFNVLNTFLDFANSGSNQSYVYQGNAEGNLFVSGPDTSSGEVPIVFASTTPPGMTAYIAGNEAHIAGLSYSTQSDLVNSSGSTGTPNYSTRQAVHANGLSVTTIGSTTQNKEDFFNLVCSNAGPRPADRLPQFQAICDNIQARFDGTGNQGGIINDPGTGNTGYPTVASNSCDPAVANSCGTGKPAIPDITSQSAMKDTACGASCAHINAMFTWLSDTHCAVMPSGATGC